MVWFLIVPILLAAAGFLYQRLGERADVRRFPPPGRKIDSLHVYELGDSGPSVVFESGIAATSISWRLVQPRVAQFARTISYDRAGLGCSDPIRGPRSLTSMNEQLHSMLARAGLPPPYILVGHSFGGMLVRHYAAQYPEEVAGIVLVDALWPGEWYPMTTPNKKMLGRGITLSRRGAMLARAGVVRFCLTMVQNGSRFLPRLIAKASGGSGASVLDRLAGEIAKLPQELWPVVASHWSNPKSFEAMAQHFECLPLSAEEMAAGSDLGDLPVVVLTAANAPGAPFAAAEPLSANRRDVLAAGSGHWIMLDEPELVVDAVRTIGRLRAGDNSWTLDGNLQSDG